MKKLLYSFIFFATLFVSVSTTKGQVVKHSSKTSHIRRVSADVEAYNFHLEMPLTKSKPGKIVVFTVSDDNGGVVKFKSTWDLVKRLNAECAQVEKPRQKILRCFVQGVIKEGGSIPTITDYQIRNGDIQRQEAEELLEKAFGGPLPFSN